MLYAVTVALILLLVVASCIALILGVLGEVGVVRYLRCSGCEHLVVTSGQASAPRCPYCRHHHLAHPLRTLQHPIRELVHH